MWHLMQHFWFKRQMSHVLCLLLLCLCVQVKLPQRVPHGFHAMWVTGQQIKQQQLPGLALQAAK
jgi:hypothetical protein